MAQILTTRIRTAGLKALVSIYKRKPFGVPVFDPMLTATKGGSAYPKGCPAQALCPADSRVIAVLVPGVGRFYGLTSAREHPEYLCKSSFQGHHMSCQGVFPVTFPGTFPRRANRGPMAVLGFIPYTRTPSGGFQSDVPISLTLRGLHFLSYPRMVRLPFPEVWSLDVQNS